MEPMDNSSEIRKTLEGRSIAVIGGCGHVGLPLGIKLTLAGARTVLIDVDAKAVSTVNSGKLPFLERGGEEQLASALALGLRATEDLGASQTCETLVFAIGTPIDEHLNPKISEVLDVFDRYMPFLQQNTLVVMRSTLFPGTMDHLYRRLRLKRQDVRLAFCPERVAQGHALDEIDSLPQIVSAFDDESFDSSYAIFSALAPEIVRLEPLEAEMAKLMANSWRYLEFAIANQFYMIAESSGISFDRIYKAIRYRYPRAQGYKSPGFAAGPCLFKDTMQLASYYDHRFSMGHAAMLVNEGLADFVIKKALGMLEGSLWGRTVGLLGLTFKADSDDVRDSLSYKLKKGFEFQGARVLSHDPYIPGSHSLDELRSESEAIVVCAPHSQFRGLSFEQPVIDVWAFLKEETLEVLPGRGK